LGEEKGGSIYFWGVEEAMVREVVESLLAFGGWWSGIGQDPILSRSDFHALHIVIPCLRPI
jgi:hypothetical protein